MYTPSPDLYPTSLDVGNLREAARDTRARPHCKIRAELDDLVGWIFADGEFANDESKQ